MVAKMQPASAEPNLRQLVLDQIREKVKLTEWDIHVAADSGVVTLTGTVPTNADRLAAEGAANQARGVRAVADDLVIRPSEGRSSTQIAREALISLRNHIFLADEAIKVIVRDGAIILEGTVHNELQKMLAEAQTKKLRGILGISNRLAVNAQALLSEAEAATLEGGLSPEPGSNETGEAEAG